MPRLVSGIGEDFAYEATVTAGVAIAEGDVLDISGNVLQRATASSTIHTLAAVAAQTITTTATTIRVIPIIGNESQIWEFDTKNNTHATNQTYENCILEDHDSLDNTGTTVTGPTGVFTIMAPVGVVGDKKVLGHFNRLQVTST